MDFPHKDGESSIVQNVHSFSKTYWDAAESSKEFNDAKIGTIFKKRNRTQCGDCGVLLLSTADKILVKVLLFILQQAESKILPESQCCS